MAYEAMNNAGAMNSRLIVILNDNDMSIAPPVGAMSAYLARLISGRTYRSLREIGKQLAKRLPKFVEQKARARRGIRARLRHRRHAVRGARLLLCRPDRRSQPRSPAAGAEERARRQERPDPGPRRDAEGQGLRARPKPRADKYHGVVKFDVVTGKQAKAKANAPSYTKVFGESLVKEAQKDDKIVAHHRRDAVAAPASTSSARRFPERTFDVGIAEQHARDVRGRPRDRRLQAVLRDLLDLPAARLRPGRARRRDPEAAGALRARPRRPRRRRRPDPCRLVRRRLSRLPARLRADGGGRRGRARPHGRDRRSRSTIARRRCAIRAATASASTCRRSACRSRSARAASSARAPRSRCSRSARGSRNA